MTLAPTLRPYLGMAVMAFLLSFTLLSTTQCSRIDRLGLANVNGLLTALPDLVRKGNEPFSKHADAITKAQSDIEKACEHAKGRKRNKEVAESWRILKDEVSAPVFKNWKEKGKLDKDFAAASADQMAKMLQAILNAEKRK
jgi:hypothetical protein